MTKSEKQHLLFESIEGFELFELKAFEDLSKRSFAEYMSLMEVVNHISSIPKKDVYNPVIEKQKLNIDWLKINGVTVLHCDKLFASQKQELLENGIKMIIGQSSSVMRGIRANLKKFSKKEVPKNLIINVAQQFNRLAIGDQKDEYFIIHLAYEIEILESELKNLKLQNSMIEESNEKDGAKEILSKMIIEKEELAKIFRELLGEKIKSIAPNLRVILNDDISVCHLIHKAGGLSKLATTPASTIQLLGAEKALFKAIKKRVNTPKHGTIIFNTVKEMKGSIGSNSRKMANKCCIASKIDAFYPESDIPVLVEPLNINSKIENNSDDTKKRQKVE